MASSGTYTFAMQIDDYCMEAFERIGKTNDALKVPQMRAFRRSMNLMFASWANQGVNLWTLERVSVTLAANASPNTVTTGAGTVDVLDTTLTVDDLDRVMTPISRTDWEGIPDKTQAGDPTQYWVDRTLPTPVIHLWTVQSEADRVLNYWRMRQLQDVSALAQDANAPYLWFDAISAGMAARMAEKYAPELFEQKLKLADQALALAKGENRERVPMQIVFDNRGWG